MASFVQRATGAARLDPNAFEDVEADVAATPQAIAVVLAVCLASGLGTPGVGVTHPQAFLASTVAALIGWVAWASLTYLIGTRLFPVPETRADLGQLLRTTGFSAAPGVFRIFGLVPVIGLPIFLLVSLWMLAAMVVAVRQALDYPTTARAIGVCITGWVLSLVIALIIGVIFAPTVS